MAESTGVLDGVDAEPEAGYFGREPADACEWVSVNASALRIAVPSALLRRVAAPARPALGREPRWQRHLTILTVARIFLINLLLKKVGAHDPVKQWLRTFLTPPPAP